jgi:subtilisin-like proprotein convertase family protein
LAIPDEGYTVHNMTVTQAGTITDMAMGVTIDHTYVGDLAILLYHPDGSYAILRNQTGGDGDSINDVYGVGGIPVAGLNDFKGKPMAGTWSLVIYDVWAEDTGTLNGTSMYFEFKQ